MISFLVERERECHKSKLCFSSSCFGKIMFGFTYLWWGCDYYDNLGITMFHKCAYLCVWSEWSFLKIWCLLVFEAYFMNDILVWRTIFGGSTYLSRSAFRVRFCSPWKLSLTSGGVTWCRLGYISWCWSGIKWGPRSSKSSLPIGKYCDYCVVMLIYKKTTRLKCFLIFERFRALD